MAKRGVKWQTDLTIAEINEKIAASEDIFIMKYKFWKRKKIGEKHLLNVCFWFKSDAYIWYWSVEFLGYMLREDDKTIISGRMKLYVRLKNLVFGFVSISMLLAGVGIFLFAPKDDWLTWAFAFGFTIAGTFMCYSFFDEGDTNKSALTLLKETLEATDIDTE